MEKENQYPNSFTSLNTSNEAKGFKALYWFGLFNLRRSLWTVVLFPTQAVKPILFS